LCGRKPTQFPLKGDLVFGRYFVQPIKKENGFTSVKSALEEICRSRVCVYEIPANASRRILELVSFDEDRQRSWKDFTLASAYR
jgi:hypothetical protein